MVLGGGADHRRPADVDRSRCSRKSCRRAPASPRTDRGRRRGDRSPRCRDGPSPPWCAASPRMARRPPWIAGMQRLDAAVHHFRVAGEGRDVATGRPASASARPCPPVETSTTPRPRGLGRTRPAGSCRRRTEARGRFGDGSARRPPGVGRFWVSRCHRRDHATGSEAPGDPLVARFGSDARSMTSCRVRAARPNWRNGRCPRAPMSWSSAAKRQSRPPGRPSRISPAAAPWRGTIERMEMKAQRRPSSRPRQGWREAVTKRS